MIKACVKEHRLQVQTGFDIRQDTSPPSSQLPRQLRDWVSYGIYLPGLITRSLGSLISSMAERIPSLPKPESLTPP